MIYESKTIIGGSCHKYNFCRDKRVFVATKKRQKYACHDKTVLVAANSCRNKHTFVATSILLSQQAYFCRDKHVLVATKIILAPITQNVSCLDAFVIVVAFTRCAINFFLNKSCFRA